MQNYQYSPLTLLYILHVLQACDPCTFHDVTLWCYEKPWQSTWKATCNIKRLFNSLQWMKKANQHFSSILLKQNLQKKKKLTPRMNDLNEATHSYIYIYIYIALMWTPTMGKNNKQVNSRGHISPFSLSQAFIVILWPNYFFLKIPLKRFIFTRFSTGSNQTQHTLPDRLLIVAVHSAYCISQQVC